MNSRSLKKRIIFYMIIFVCVAVLLEIVILSTINGRSVGRASNVMLDQIDGILTANEKKEKDTLKELKIEYIESANTVAYILDKNKDSKNNKKELRKISNMMGIDEINIFDKKGVIVGGTEPEYYGMSFDSGKQISYFKPMLKDKNKSMCQDVIPNTATAKKMMYAIVWNKHKNYMVQIGVEPVRLIDSLKKNDLSNVVDQMTVYEGMSIHIADIKSGKILGTTDESYFGKNIYDSSIVNINDDYHRIKEKEVDINGFKNYCYFRQHGNYIITVVHSTKSNLESFLVAIIIEVVWLLIAAVVVTYILLKLANANKKIKDRMSILNSISNTYYSMHLIDMHDFSIEKLESNDLMDKVVDEGSNAIDMLDKIVRDAIDEKYLENALTFVDLSTLNERLKNKNSISFEAIDNYLGWLRLSFIAVGTNKKTGLDKVIIATQIIDEDKKKEEELSKKAYRDKLTGLLNRRAYEDDMSSYQDAMIEDDFVYAAIDINGLKVTNDELGHVAGDELIKGAAGCLMRTFGSYGKVYRTGGDEFVAIFFTNDKHLEELIADLESMTEEWKGKIVQYLSLSVGYVAKSELGNTTVDEISKIADERMYEAKDEYYALKGVDRRGQAAAHTALCNSYTKILKINLTNDMYSIISMDLDEQTEEKGFSDKISAWLHDFAESGQVHEDDLEEYYEKTSIDFLKDYFSKGKMSISILYRRKYGDEYKQVVMDMMPADDYSQDNQSLYLYVKSIDK